MRNAGDGVGPFGGPVRDRPLRVLIDLPPEKRRSDDTGSWTAMGVPDPGRFLWSLCRRDDVETSWTGEDGEEAPGRITLGEVDLGVDHRLYVVEHGGGRALRSICPYNQWVTASGDLARRLGLDAAAALDAAVIVGLALDLRTDVVITDRALLLDRHLRRAADVNAVPIDVGLATVGLYLRSIGEWPIWAPDLLDMGPHLMRWVTARSLLPSGWRWGNALVAHSFACGLEGPLQLFQTTHERIVRVLRYRDALHCALLVPHTKTTADEATESLDNLMVNLVGAFDAAARVAHLVAGHDPRKRNGAGWQKETWRRTLDVKALDDLFVAGSAGCHLFRICRLLRNTVHGEGLQQSGVSDGGKPRETLLGLPEDDAAELIEECDELGGHEAWGTLTLHGKVRMRPAVFVERLLPAALRLLDEVLRLTPVEDLPGVDVTVLNAEPPTDNTFGLGTRVRACLLHGLPPPQE